MSREAYVKQLHQNIDELDNYLPRAVECLSWMVEKLLHKGHDYAGMDDPLENLRGSEEVEVPSHRGVLVRMRDKWRRIINFNRVGRLKVGDESISQTILDMANYCILLNIVWIMEQPMQAADAMEAEDTGIRPVREVSHAYEYRGHP